MKDKKVISAISLISVIAYFMIKGPEKNQIFLIITFFTFIVGFFVPWLKNKNMKRVPADGESEIFTLKIKMGKMTGWMAYGLIAVITLFLFYRVVQESHFEDIVPEVCLVILLGIYQIHRYLKLNNPIILDEKGIFAYPENIRWEQVKTYNVKPYTDHIYIFLEIINKKQINIFKLPGFVGLDVTGRSAIEIENVLEKYLKK